MRHKIDKDYLGDALRHFDNDGNQIIDPSEWIAYFMEMPTVSQRWQSALKMMIRILEGVFPNEDPKRIPVLAQAIIINHSTNTDEGRIINFEKFYDYVIRFIAPQKYRAYQRTLENKTQFFLYDGVIEREEFEIFTDKEDRILSADIYYFIIAYHISPTVAAEIIDIIIKNPSTHYRESDFSLDADAVFDLLSCKKDGHEVIDIDALIHYVESNNIQFTNIDSVYHLFGIHMDLLKAIKHCGIVSEEIAYYFFNFCNKMYLKLAIQSLLGALSVELEDIYDMLKIIEFLNYIGNPRKLFREIAGTKDHFTLDDLSQFLKDNQIPFSLKN